MRPTDTPVPAPARSLPRLVLTWAALAAALVVLVWHVGKLLEDPSIWPPDDFVEYYAAGRLNAHGLNPYDPELLLPLERAAGRDTDVAIMMWNPPWTLTVAMPFGLMPARVAQLLWLALHFAAVLFCADRLWKHYGGSPARRWVPFALTLTFLPTFFVLQSGQISVLMLLGCVGFLAFLKQGRPLLAGAATVLIAVKPHLFVLFWVAAGVWAVRRREWRFVLGGACAGALATLVPLACNPALLSQYWEAMTQRPPAQWVSPTIGTLLRLFCGQELFRLQFVPLLAGVAWLGWYAARRRERWDWSEQLPLLVLVSLVTAPYGAWPFDMVLLLLPALHLATRLSAAPDRVRVAGAIFAYLCIDLAALALNLLAITSFWFIWMAPSALAAYALLIRPPAPPEPRPALGTAA